MIDKNGKLFGKLNIIDLIAIILIVAVLALIGYKLTSNTDTLAGEGQKIVYTVKVKNVEPEVYEAIKGMLPSQLMASEELLDANVTDVQATPTETDTYTMTYNTNLGKDILTKTDGENLDLVFTIEGTVKDSLTSELGTQEIRVGKSHIVKTTTFELEGGVITSCQRE